MIKRGESQSKNIYENYDVINMKSPDIEREKSGNEHDISAPSKINNEKSGGKDDIFASADFEEQEDTDAPPVGIIWTGEEWIRLHFQKVLFLHNNWTLTLNFL